MKKNCLLLIIFATFILTSCSFVSTTEGAVKEVTVENTKEAMEETAKGAAKHLPEETTEAYGKQPADDSFAQFIAGEVMAHYKGKDRKPFYITELPMDAEDYFSYSIGDRVDLDNDGEKELILEGPYGGMYLDIKGDKVYVLEEGLGTAGTLRYTKIDGKTWIVHCDTTHDGRSMYFFTLYDGEGQVVEEFELSKVWDMQEEMDGPQTVYTYRDELITREEYEALEEQLLRSTYFFNDAGTKIYDAKFTECQLETEVELSINEVNQYYNGSLYELKLNGNEEMEQIYGERMHLGYFFVQGDKIYKINTEKCLMEQMTAEELLEQGTLVCREAEMPDVLEEEEGWHEYIEENGDRREYHGYGTWGSNNYYEHFVWEWGKGLVAYRSGYGAESYGIELHLK